MQSRILPVQGCIRTVPIGTGPVKEISFFMKERILPVLVRKDIIPIRTTPVQGRIVLMQYGIEPVPKRIRKIQ